MLGAKEAVDAWGREVIETDDRFLGWYERAGLQAALAGQLMVRGVELAEEAEDGAAGTVALERAWVRNPEDSFLGMPYLEALEWFRDKLILTPEEFELFQDRFRIAGFTSRTLTSRSLRETAHAGILEILNAGGTVRDVVNAIEDEELGLGITPTAPHLVEMIARTNVASAYGHGRWQAMQDPDVRALRPYFLFVTAGDSRVRPSHAALHMAVVPIDSPLAEQIAPPLGFNCRCSSVTLSDRQLETRGLTVLDTLPFGAGPDPGWEGAPAPLAA